MQERLEADPRSADQLPLTTGLGALLRGFKHAEIFKEDLAKTDALDGMVSGAKARASAMYAELKKEDRNMDGVGRLGLAFGLDGNPMFTGNSTKSSIVPLSFPVPDAVVEEKEELIAEEKEEISPAVKVNVSGIPGNPPDQR